MLHLYGLCTNTKLQIRNSVLRHPGRCTTPLPKVQEYIIRCRTRTRLGTLKGQNPKTRTACRVALANCHQFRIGCMFSLPLHCKLISWAYACTSVTYMHILCTFVTCMHILCTCVTCMHTRRLYVQANVTVYICVCAHIRTCACVRVCMCMCACACVRVDIYVCAQKC
jgi:hypothetical protein